MTDDLFEAVLEYPNEAADADYATLVGLDEVKHSLELEAALLLNPAILEDWSQQQYNKRIAANGLFRTRPPLFLFSGDVGTGKTALAESFASKIARDHSLNIYLYKLSLNARGSGMVGEMTKLLASAFSEISEQADRLKNGKNALVLMIDEADALAQSRESGQMHHEDRAGVNALIRGVDSCKRMPTPVVVIMCTNRPEAIDPALRRRAVEQYEFTRPNLENCERLLSEYLGDTGITAEELTALATQAVQYPDCEYGYTFSDLTQRVIPGALLACLPDKPLTQEVVQSTMARIKPTPPFTVVPQRGR